MRTRRSLSKHELGTKEAQAEHRTIPTARQALNLTPAGKDGRIFTAMESAPNLTTHTHRRFLEDRQQILAENERLRAEIATHKKLTFRLRDSYVKITQSILSAKHIQKIALPGERRLQQVFPGAVLMDRPRDVVSGDFFWAMRHQSWRILGVVDSTGHGIPGAMMSMIGHNVFEQTLKEGSFDVLGRLLDQVSMRLKTRDRMISDCAISTASNDLCFDAAVLAVHDSGQRVMFSGAVMDCFRIRDGHAEIWRGDRASLGGSHMRILRATGGTEQFSTIEMESKPGDQFYLMSDGLRDQFGGDNERKLGRKRLAELLVEHSCLPADERIAAIHRSFLLWKGANEQVDDVILVGLTL